MNLEDSTKLKGEIEMLIHDIEGNLIEKRCFQNAVVKKGRSALASALANKIGSSFNFFISRMIWGDGGTQEGIPKFVSGDRNGLFGITRVSKPVITTIDPEAPYRAVFTSVVAFGDGNGYTLNEMALKMENGDLYSMATFGGVAKTSSMQITYKWSLSFL